MKLSPGLQALAVKLQEQLDELSNSDVCRWLTDALRELDGYAYYIDHFGDGKSGDVIYSCSGDMKRAPYEIRSVNGKVTASIDDENAIDVLPRTTYEPEADEADHYASMESARGEDGPLYTKTPMYERFISKAERDAADSGSFAGKGKSFPILKPGDVMAAVRSMGRAGSGNYDTGTLKRNIVRIAKKKGFGKSLPKAWQDEQSDDGKEAAVDIDLTGDVVALKEGAVGQDGTAYLKLIAPGWGSSGYYPADVLERDGSKVFPKGTKNFWNHQTDAEEAARPEGDLRDLASVLTEDAHFDSKGPAGPGLYAKAKVFEQFRQPVDDLASHIGMSIRANGKAREGQAPDGKKGRIIEQLTKGHSVDYVTTPGAGGKILQLFEAARKPARTIPAEGGADDVEALKEVKKLRERLALREGADYVRNALAGERLNEATKARLVGRIVESIPLTEDGEVDEKKLDKIIEREVKDEVEYLAKLSGGRLVTGMGDGLGKSKKELKKERKAREASDADFEQGMKEVGRTLGLGKEGRRLFVTGRGEVA